MPPIKNNNERKCESDGRNYKSSSRQFRCKNCKMYWFAKSPVPTCKTPEINTVFPSPSKNEPIGGKCGQIFHASAGMICANENLCHVHTHLPKNSPTPHTDSGWDWEKEFDFKIKNTYELCIDNDAGGLLGENNRILEIDIEGVRAFIRQVVSQSRSSVLEELGKRVCDMSRVTDKSLYADVEQRIDAALENHDLIIYNKALSDILSIIQSMK